MIVYSSVYCKINTEDGTEIPTEWEYDPENMTIGDGFYHTYEEALADIRIAGFDPIPPDVMAELKRRGEETLRQIEEAKKDV